MLGVSIFAFCSLPGNTAFLTIETLLILTAYHPVLIRDNSNNPRLLFSTVSTLVTNLKRNKQYGSGMGVAEHQLWMERRQIKPAGNT